MNLQLFPDLVLHNIIRYSDIHITKLVCKKFYSFLDNGIGLRKEEIRRIYAHLRGRHTCAGIIELCLLTNAQLGTLKYTIKQYKKILGKFEDAKPRLLLYLLKMATKDIKWAQKKLYKYFPVEGNNTSYLRIDNLLCSLDEIHIDKDIFDKLRILFPYAKNSELIQFIYQRNYDQIISYFNASKKLNLIDVLVFYAMIDMGDPKILVIMLKHMVTKISHDTLQMLFYTLLFKYGSYNLIHRLLEYVHNYGTILMIKNIQLQKIYVLLCTRFQSESVKHLLYINDIRLTQNEYIPNLSYSALHFKTLTDEVIFDTITKLFTKRNYGLDHESYWKTLRAHTTNCYDNLIAFMQKTAIFVGDITMYEKYNNSNVSTPS
jgi:hypothetical protein